MNMKKIDEDRPLMKVALVFTAISIAGTIGALLVPDDWRASGLFASVAGAVAVIETWFKSDEKD